jgi:hypothetical protein
VRVLEKRTRGLCVSGSDHADATAPRACSPIDTGALCVELGLTGNRGEFVVAVQVTTTFPSKAPCSPVFSLETFDSATGATHIFLGNAVAARPVNDFPFDR